MESPGFAEQSWEAAQLAVLEHGRPSKYRDYNLRNVLLAPPDKDTFEVRVLPATLDVVEILAGVAPFEAVLSALMDGEVAPEVVPDRSARALRALLDALPLEAAAREFWRTALAR